eukprot:CFRG7990T1
MELREKDSLTPTSRAAKKPAETPSLLSDTFSGKTVIELDPSKPQQEMSVGTKGQKISSSTDVCLTENLPSSCENSQNLSTSRDIPLEQGPLESLSSIFDTSLSCTPTLSHAHVPPEQSPSGLRSSRVSKVKAKDVFLSSTDALVEQGSSLSPPESRSLTLSSISNSSYENKLLERNPLKSLASLNDISAPSSSSQQQALERRDSRSLLRPFMLKGDVSVDFDEQPLYFDGPSDALREEDAFHYENILADIGATAQKLPKEPTLRSVVIHKSGGQRYGLSVSSVNSSIHIALVLPGSPAEKAGLRVGDRLHEFNGQDLRGQDPSTLLKNMNSTSTIISLLVGPCEFIKAFKLTKANPDDRLGLQLESCKIQETVPDTVAHTARIPSKHFLVYINDVCVVGMDITRIISTLALRGSQVDLEIMPEREYTLLMIQFGSDSMARKLLDKPLTPAQIHISEPSNSVFNWNFIETGCDEVGLKRSISHFEETLERPLANTTPSTPVLSLDNESSSPRSQISSVRGIIFSKLASHGPSNERRPSTRRNTREGLPSLSTKERTSESVNAKNSLNFLGMDDGDNRISSERDETTESSRSHLFALKKKLGLPLFW